MPWYIQTMTYKLCMYGRYFQILNNHKLPLWNLIEINWKWWWEQFLIPEYIVFLLVSNSALNTTEINELSV